MIDVHWINSPNGRKVSIMLEETKLPHKLIDYSKTPGANLTREFRAINPNARIPAIVDHAPADGGDPYPVFESGAILIYLADKSGQFLSQTDMRKRHDTIQWVTWQMAGLGPMHGQAHHFIRQAPEPVDPYATERYRREAERLLFVLNRRLRDNEYVAGDEYTIADMAIWPWLCVLYTIHMKISDFAHIQRWYDLIEKRPGVQAGCKIPYTAPAGRLTIPEEAWSRAFGDKMHEFHRTD